MSKMVYFDDVFSDFNMNNYYFIDKTKMISKLINNMKKVYLITRPRRFGKSLNIRMIKEFFEKPNNENNDGLETFDGLEISKDRKNMREFHKYPVITLNFKKDNLEDYESNIEFLKTEISNLYKYHRKNIDFNKLDDDEQQNWSQIEKKIENVQLLEQSIKFLMKCLNKFYKRKCIVLIDEYDNILTNCFNENYYEKLNQFFKSMFSSIFKSNEYLHFGVATGCVSLSFKSLFSGPNNFNDCSMYFDRDFSDCYGFTEKELDKLLLHFKFSNIDKESIKERYDGYSCSANNSKGIVKNLYNPYSIMKFLYDNTDNKKKYKLESYWINSGSDFIIRNILKNHNYIFEIDFLSVLYGNPIIVEINKNLDLNSKPFKKNDLWTLLLYSGYITIIDQEEYEKLINQMDGQVTKLLLNKPEKEKNINSIQKYKDELRKRICENKMNYVKVPNKEILENFSKLLETTIGSLLGKENNEIIENYIKDIIEGIFEKDINKINNNLNNYLMIFSSYHLFKHANTYENIYQVLLMQLFIFWKVRGLTAEEDSGLGRYDIGFPNKKKENEYILIEVKVYKADKESNDEEEDNKKIKYKKNKNKKNMDKIENYLHKECINALKQIEEKKFASKHKINNYNSFIKYGIAFYKKNCRVEMKINEDEIQSPSKINVNNDNNNDDGINNYSDDINNNDDENDNDDNVDNNNKKRTKIIKINNKTARGRGRGKRIKN